jgi:DNA-binding GntR family transcriptional regulator
MLESVTMSDPTTTARPNARRGAALFGELKERLLAGFYPPGTRISIEEMKAQFGVSKQPIMDAMRRLEASGIVEIVPQSGCRVVQYTAQEISDFFNLFGRFEGEIAAAAAARRSEAQLLDLDEAWHSIAVLDESGEDRDRAGRYRRLNREYHAVIHRMSDSRVMADLSARMWDLSDFLVTAVGGIQRLSESIKQRNDDHDVIRTAIRSRNSDVARAAMESHIVTTVAAFAGDDAGEY